MEVRFPVVWVAQTRFDYDTATPAQRKTWNNDACDQIIKAAPMYTSCVLYYNRHQISYVKLTTKFSGAGEAGEEGRVGAARHGRSGTRVSMCLYSSCSRCNLLTPKPEFVNVGAKPAGVWGLSRCGSSGNNCLRFRAGEQIEREEVALLYPA